MNDAVHTPIIGGRSQAGAILTFSVHVADFHEKAAELLSTPNEYCEQPTAFADELEAPQKISPFQSLFKKASTGAT